MKKLFIILLAVFAIDAGIFIAFANVNKSQQSIHQELLARIERERGELREDASLTQRERELKKLFKKSKYPIKGEVECYVFVPTEESNIFCGTTYGNVIVVNENYKDLDGVLLHELCHVALHEHSLETNEAHDTQEWIYLFNYFKDLGYNIYNRELSFLEGDTTGSGNIVQPLSA